MHFEMRLILLVSIKKRVTSFYKHFRPLHNYSIDMTQQLKLLLRSTEHKW